MTIESKGLGHLFTALKEEGYRILGPSMREGAIIYEELSSVDELPAGWSDEQEKGTYRLKSRADGAVFGFNAGPHSWKKFLFPSSQLLYRAKRSSDGFQILPEDGPVPKCAFIGVRPCDLQAIAVQDRVFIGGKYHDASYKARRESGFIVAVNCGQASGTCFCASMGSGPGADAGFDLALTEVLADGTHFFVCETGTGRGARILASIPHRPATDKETAAASEVVANTARQMGRSLETAGLAELLARCFEDARWDEVATRCLSCANCTIVCPTCFCSTVEEVTELTADHTERWRKWDSCFTVDFTHVAGGSIRASVKARYRQWLTHKLGTWQEQFGVLGCVGCGRCITWCPTGIDLTEEIRALRQTGKASTEGDK